VTVRPLGDGSGTARDGGGAAPAAAPAARTGRRVFVASPQCDAAFVAPSCCAGGDLLRWAHSRVWSSLEVMRDRMPAREDTWYGGT
jgi:hypothetical protein